MNSASRLIKRHFLGGLFVLIPFAVAAWLVYSAFELLWGLGKILPESIRPENVFHSWLTIALVKFAVVVAISLVIGFLISVLGWSSQQIIGRRILSWITTALIQKIPLVRSIYGALDQLLKTMASGDTSQFSKTVYVQYPHEGSYTLAFVTGNAVNPTGGKEHYINVFVPTTPNPTSGFYLIVKESDTKPSNLTVEEAFRTILSLGVGYPHERK